MFDLLHMPTFIITILYLLVFKIPLYYLFDSLFYLSKFASRV